MQHRRRRILAWIGASVLTIIALGVIGILIWTQTGVAAAEAEPLDAVRANDAIVVTEEPEGIMLSPADGASEVGLVFIPGAKVDPAAYAAKLQGAVIELGMTVVITRPVLNVAFFDLRPLSDFTALAPDVDSWAVGGHSLGGVRACALASDADGLVLFASYCSSDISDAGIPVLSISGPQDGLSTPQKIADAAPLLPTDAVFVEVEGANHASFGDYGAQSGDGVSTIEDAEMTAELTEQLGRFALELR